MAKHLMLDMETLAVSPAAMVLSLGAVHFDPLGQGHLNQLYFKINLEDQEALNREIDPNTIDWWGTQPIDVREEAFNEQGRIPLQDAMEQFHKFAWGCDAFWSHGATFDLVIIENLYKQLGKGLPWNYWQLRDTRTLFDLGFSPSMPQESKHDALQDAIRQAIGVQNIYRQINELKNENR